MQQDKCKNIFPVSTYRRTWLVGARDRPMEDNVKVWVQRATYWSSTADMWDQAETEAEILSSDVPEITSDSDHLICFMTGNIFCLTYSWHAIRSLELLPLAVTALLPIVLFPILGILTTNQASAVYLKVIIMILLLNLFEGINEVHNDPASWRLSVCLFGSVWI